MNAHPGLRPTLRLQASPSYLDREAEAASIIEALRELEPRHRLLVVDTFSANFTGKENTDDAAAFVRSCQRIALEADVTVLVIHHLGKDGDKGARGHSSLTANTDFWLTLDRPDKGKRVVRLRQGKLKDAAFERDLWFEAVSVPVEGCGDFKDSLVLRPTSRPRANETTTVEDEVDEQIRTILGHVKDGDPVTPVQQAIQDLGLSQRKAVQRMEETLEGMPQLSIEKLGGSEGNRRVFRVRK